MVRSTHGDGCSRGAHLPPHRLADSVGTTTEPLGGCRQIIGLILKMVETLATLRHLVDVVAHHTNGIIDLLKMDMSAIKFGNGTPEDSTSPNPVLLLALITSAMSSAQCVLVTLGLQGLLGIVGDCAAGKWESLALA